LHQASFSRELHDTPVKLTMNLDNPWCMEEMQHDLLRGAGCSMELDGKCTACDAESTQRCAIQVSLDMALWLTMPIATLEAPQTHLQQMKQGLKLNQSNCLVLSSHVFHKLVWCHTLKIDCSCSWTA
jgi:hypothetical protein